LNLQDIWTDRQGNSYIQTKLAGGEYEKLSWK